MLHKRTIPVEQLRPRQVLAESALKGGVIIVPKGAVVTEAIIQELKHRQVPGVTIFQNEDEAAAPATDRQLAELAQEAGRETLAANAPPDFVKALPQENYHAANPLLLISDEDREKSAAAKPAAVRESAEGLVLTGAVGLGHGNIDTQLPVVIEGSVLGGISIHSQGSITVTGEIFGAVIVCGGNVVAKTVRHAVIVSYSSLKCESVTDTIVDVKERIEVNQGNGIIIGGRLIAGGMIIGKRVGNIERTLTELCITGELPKIVYKQLLTTEATIKTLQAEVGQLKKVIDLIQMLGQKVATLPDAKKQQLKQQSDMYFARKQQLDEAGQQKQRLEQEMTEFSDNDYCPIRITEVAYSGLKIVIDGTEFQLDKINHNVGFYKKKMILIRLFR